VDISCPVSCKFPHGTLHYQSRKFSGLVGGSTLFNPYVMYEFISAGLSSLCTGCSLLCFHTRHPFSSNFSIHLTFLTQANSLIKPLQVLPISLATTFGLSVDYFILVLRCFNSQLFSTFFCMLSHLWNPALL